MKRNATAKWNGSGKEGNGVLTTQSHTLDQTAYSYTSRFEEGQGTNPEELMAAAHAGCFSMKLAFVLGAAGHEPKSIVTSCEITLENGAITRSALLTQVDVGGMDEDAFQKAALEAKENCPVSKAYNMEISLEARQI